MTQVQNTSSKEWKEEAVRLAQTSGKPIAHSARELGISDSAIHGWRRELAKHPKEAFPGSGHQTALEEEKRRLKRELERVQQERERRKKVLSIFFPGSHRKSPYIEQHTHPFPIVVMGQVLGVEGSAALTPGASGPPVSTNEKMLTSPKSFDRCLTGIRAEMAALASTASGAIRDGASRTRGWPGSCGRRNAQLSASDVGCSPPNEMRLIPVLTMDSSGILRQPNRLPHG